MIALLSSRLLLGSVSVVGVIASLFLALQLGRAHGTIKGLNKDIVTTNDAWKACQVREAAANVRIQVQNGEIEDWRQKAQDAQTQADRRVAQARREAQAYRERNRVLAARQPVGDHCAAASALYVEEIGRE
ncbi:MAG TPA: hypothetical protein VJ775_05985 [Sphingomicrobium sp.]|nr:hypothetical protein [Sphingomicrobium sp.]